MKIKYLCFQDDTKNVKKQRNFILCMFFTLSFSKAFAVDFDHPRCSLILQFVRSIVVGAEYERGLEHAGLRRELTPYLMRKFKEQMPMGKLDDARTLLEHVLSLLDYKVPPEKMDALSSVIGTLFRIDPKLDKVAAAKVIANFLKHDGDLVTMYRFAGLAAKKARKYGLDPTSAIELALRNYTLLNDGTGKSRKLTESEVEVALEPFKPKKVIPSLSEIEAQQIKYDESLARLSKMNADSNVSGKSLIEQLKESQRELYRLSELLLRSKRVGIANEKNRAQTNSFLDEQTVKMKQNIEKFEKAVQLIGRPNVSKIRFERATDLFWSNLYHPWFSQKPEAIDGISTKQ